MPDASTFLKELPGWLQGTIYFFVGMGVFVMILFRLNWFKKNGNGKGVTRKELDEILEKKMDGVMYTDTCDARFEGLKDLIELGNKNTVKQVDDLKKSFNDTQQFIISEIKKAST